MKRWFASLARNTRASSAAEFALVLPLLLIFLLGIIDVGRLMWTWNRAEKATQMGVRYAIAADMVPRSEEHTSELQSLMRISYAVFCLKKKKNEKVHIPQIAHRSYYVHTAL